VPDHASSEWTHAAVALGSNLGDRLDALTRAAEALERHAHARSVSRSAVYETPPVGPEGQGPYLNAAVTLETDLDPLGLLELLLHIEREGGRVRSETERWGPRTIDLDLLLYTDRVINEPGLRVPHPRLVERAFVLAPLRGVAQGWRVPGSGVTVGEAWAALETAGEAGEIRIYQPASARGWASL